MTVFKYLMKSIWRMKGIIFTYAIIFLIISSINQGTGNSEKATFSDSALNLILVRQDDSKLGDAFLDYLEDKHHVEVSNQPIEKLRERIFVGEMDGIIILPENLEDEVLKKSSPVQIVTNNSNSSSLVYSVTNGYFTMANAVLSDEGASFETLNKAVAKQAKVSILNSDKSESQNAISIWAATYFNFITYMLIAIFIAVFGNILSSFQETKLLQRQVISSTSLTSINQAKLMACAVVAFLVTTLFVAGSLIFKPSLLSQASFLKYIIIAYAFACSALSMAFLTSVIVGNNRFLYSGLSTVMGLGLSFTSGVFVPQELLSTPVLNFAKLFPVFYVVKTNKDMATDFSSYLPTVGILLLFALFYFVLAMAISRVRSGNKLIAL